MSCQLKRAEQRQSGWYGGSVRPVLAQMLNNLRYEIRDPNKPAAAERGTLASAHLQQRYLIKLSR